MANAPRWTGIDSTIVAIAWCVVGCTHNPFRSTATTVPPVGAAQPTGIAAFTPASSAPASAAAPSFIDADPRQLQAGLARSQEEAQVMQDEISALREQLASTSTQLAQVRAAGMSPAAAAPAAPPGTMTPVAMQSAMAGLSVPGVEKRLDGGVVRIEIPADTLFESGGANLLPSGSALLTKISDEVERVYPGHFLGIEGHTDTEPLRNASWGSQHQLSVARASAVFDFLTSRTSLKQGQLFLVAHGPNHPVVSNATAAGRARNRRIELVVYPERTGDDGGSAGHPAAAAAEGGG